MLLLQDQFIPKVKKNQNLDKQERIVNASSTDIVGLEVVQRMS